MDVANRYFAEVGGIRLLRELVPITGENALATGALESDAKAANTAEEVDEADASGQRRGLVVGRAGLTEFV